MITLIKSDDQYIYNIIYGLITKMVKFVINDNNE